MYRVNVRAYYDAAHGLRSYHGAAEPLHGHRFLLEVALETDALAEGGIAFDFVEVEAHLDALLAPYRHANLNETPPFDRVEPSAENQARHFYDALKRRMPAPLAAALVYARVWETPEQWAQYAEHDVGD